MRSKILLCFIIFIIPCVAWAQVDDLLDDLSTIDDVETEAWEQAADVLSELQAHPINLNTATREDLEQLPFLTAEQVEGLSEYIYRYGPMHSTGELAMIETLDYTTRQRLLSFVYIGETEQKQPTLADLLRHGRHELTTTGRIPFYKREGDRDGYLGYQYRHSLRYTFSSSQRLRAGFVGAQDAGEPFFANRNSWGYDHYSFYVQAHRLGRLKNITVGRYRLHFGHGLVMNNDFSLGKLVALLNTQRPTANAIRGHTSRMEYNYLQGAAATVSLFNSHPSQLDLTAFLSYRDLDATLTDSMTAIRTILTTGYHRTQSEMGRKHNASEFLAGSRLFFRHNRLHTAVTALYNSFSLPLNPSLSTQVYRQIYPTGQYFWNASADYGYRGRHFTLSGETATGSCGGIATLNTLALRPVSQLSLMAVQRFYSYRYYALHAESLSEGGQVQNESGVLLGTTWTPSRPFSLTAYTDYVYFPWARYQVSQSSHAWDNLVAATWQHNQWKFYARYRLRLRERDNTAHTALANRTEHRLRTYLAHNSNAWTLKTQLDISRQHSDDKTSNIQNSFGYMLSQSVGYSTSHSEFSAQLAYFHTDDYDSRLYLYERSPLYQISFPMLYGHGLRSNIFLRHRFTESLQLIARIATTNYFDRSAIGTGLQLIRHSHQTDLDLQLRWRF